MNSQNVDEIRMWKKLMNFSICSLFILYLIGWSANQNSSTCIHFGRTEHVMVDLSLYSKLMYFILWFLFDLCKYFSFVSFRVQFLYFGSA